MKKRYRNSEPTISMIVICAVVSCLFGWQIYILVDQLSEVLIKKTLHSWLSHPIMIGLTFLVCAIIIFCFWLTYWLSHKWAKIKEASDF